MELKDFIKETITAYSESLLELREEFRDKKVMIEPTKDTRTGEGYVEAIDGNLCYIKKLNFDIAVTTVDTKNAKGGAKISVVNFGLNSSKEDTNISRINFSVNISMPIYSNVYNIEKGE